MPWIRARRTFFLGLVLATTAAGSWMMGGVLGAGGMGPLEFLILALFVPTFGWISVAFWNSVVGFSLQALRRNPLTLERMSYSSDRRRPIGSRTAVVMPAHNEEPEAVTTGLAATLESLTRTGEAGRFDVFLLSDTTDPDIIEAEELAWSRLREQLSYEGRLVYRRRPANSGRKSGNLAEFCGRWGDEYDFMVVLDADSVMGGDALLDLVRLMEANPEAGLLQTVPVPAGQATLFGRLLQFGAALHSPLIATGQSFWQGDAANYWGHNAIVRLRPFREHCRLPVLRGNPPLGGEVLSHDFVEAALLRRAGWKVYLVPWLEASFEEVPANVRDYARRDRRWAQGSLQHLRLLFMPGLHPLSRVHFLMGAMGYLSSGLWLLLLLAGSAYVGLAEAGALGLVTDGRQVAGAGSGWPAAPPTSLLGVTAGLLFLPKGLGLVLGLLQQRGRFGGSLRLVLSALLEAAFAVLIAPVMMAYHTSFIGGIVAGRDVRWDGRTRGGGTLDWIASWRESWGMLALGAVWGGLTLYSSWVFLLWLTPILLGLLIAAPLVHWSSSLTLAEWTARLGLLEVKNLIDPTGADGSAPSVPPGEVPRARPPARPEPLPSIHTPSRTRRSFAHRSDRAAP